MKLREESCKHRRNCKDVKSWRLKELSTKDRSELELLLKLLWKKRLNRGRKQLQPLQTTKGRDQNSRLLFWQLRKLDSKRLQQKDRDKSKQLLPKKREDRRQQMRRDKNMKHFKPKKDVRSQKSLNNQNKGSKLNQLLVLQSLRE